MGARGVEDGASAVDALRAGSADGLSAVYARWSPLVYSLALRCLGDVDAAEGVTKHVFTTVWASRRAVGDARSSFSAWLIDLACARIAAVEATAGRTPEADVGTGEEDRSGGGESKPGLLAERLVLVDGLSHLDAGPRRVLRMVLDDLSPAEVAERVGLSVEDVKTQVASSLVQLRHLWEVQTYAR